MHFFWKRTHWCLPANDEKKKNVCIPPEFKVKSICAESVEAFLHGKLEGENRLILRHGANHLIHFWARRVPPRPELHSSKALAVRKCPHNLLPTLNWIASLVFGAAGHTCCFPSTFTRKQLDILRLERGCAKKKRGMRVRGNSVGWFKWVV